MNSEAAAKAAVSDEARARARKMAEDALAQKLSEIDMTAEEHAGYGDVLGEVAGEVAQLRLVLDGLRSREKERVWIWHQADGELDDNKLIDGVAGDRNVYKRRAALRRADHAFRPPRAPRTMLPTTPITAPGCLFPARRATPAATGPPLPGPPAAPTTRPPPPAALVAGFRIHISYFRIQISELTISYFRFQIPDRSEERRVGKECRSRGSPYH